jgi:hypothetical protein
MLGINSTHSGPRRRQKDSRKVQSREIDTEQLFLRNQVSVIPPDPDRTLFQVKLK